MKVVHKGIVIVVLPLVVQIGAILTLMCILDGAQNRLESSRRSRDVLSAVDTFRRDNSRGNVQALINRVDPSKKDEEKESALREKLDRSLAELDQITANHPAEQKLVEGLRKRLRLSRHVQHLMEVYPPGASIGTSIPKTGAGANFIDGLRKTVVDFFNLESRHANALPQLIQVVRGQLLATLILGIIFTFFSLILVLSLGRDIAKRNASLLDNALRLMANQPLLVPMPGDDEIAVLDATLHKSGKELLANESFRQGIIATVSHELRTPLSSLSATLSVLSSGLLGTVKESADKTLMSAASTAVRVISMINNLLDLEMIESGKLVPAKGSVKVAQQASSAMFAIEESARASNLSLRSEVSEELVISGDNAQIQRLFEELLFAVIENASDCQVCISDQELEGKLSIKIEFESTNTILLDVANLPRQAQVDGAQLAHSLRWSVCQELAQLNGLKLSVRQEGSRQIIDLKPGRADGLGFSPEDLPAPELMSRPGGWSSLRRKWLLLALPLLMSQIIFGVTILSLFTQIQQELESEYQSWNLVAKATLITTSFVRRVGAMAAYRMTSDPDLFKQRSKHQRETRESFDEFKKELGDRTEENRVLLSTIDTNLKKMDVFVAKGFNKPLQLAVEESMSKEEAVEFQSAFEGVLNPIERLIAQQNELQNQTRQFALETRRKIESVFVIALGVSVVSAILLMLSVYFMLIRRLTHLLEVSRALSERRPLGPLLGGTDELATLDRILHFVDERFSRFESFKRRSAQVIGSDLLLSLGTIRDGMQSLVDNEQLSEKALQRVQNVINDCSRLVRMVEDLMSARTMGSGRFDLKIQSTTSDEIVDAAVVSVEQLAQRSKIRIEKIGENVELECDRDRMIQVLINFLSNAIKFSPPESAVKIQVEDINDTVEFCVIDEGRGVPEEKIGLLFQRFEQSSTSDWKDKGGSGLGLYICKTIVEQHGGEIGLDSEEGVGSTFWIDLPRQSLNSRSSDESCL